MAQDASELSLSVADDAAAALSMKVVGPRAWHICRHTFQSLPCRSCSKDGLMLLSGIQDVVNVNKLGQPLYDPENFHDFKAEVDRAAEKAGLDTGRKVINKGLRNVASEPKMDMKDELAVYGGAIVEKVIDVGVKTTDGTPITPTIRNSTIGNIIFAIAGGALAYYWRKHEARGVAAAAFSAAAVNNLIEDAAKAAGLPGAGGVGGVRRISVPFVPAAGGAISPSQAAAQSGAPALF